VNSWLILTIFIGSCNETQKNMAIYIVDTSHKTGLNGVLYLFKA